MESYIIYKKDSKLPFLCKTDGYGTAYSFRKKDVTTFFNRDEAEKYYNKVVNDEYNTNKRSLSSSSSSIGYYDYGWSYRPRTRVISEETKKRRRKYNKELKQKIKNKYVLQQVGLGTKFLSIEKRFDK